MGDRGLRDLGKELAPIIKRVPKYAKLLTVLSTDTHLSIAQRMSLRSALGYMAMPIDLIPDSIPAFGRIDDIFAGLLATNSVLKTLTPEKVDEVLNQCGLSPEIVSSDQAVIKRISKDLTKSAAKKSTNAVTKFTSAWSQAFSKAVKEFRQEYKK